MDQTLSHRTLFILAHTVLILGYLLIPQIHVARVFCFIVSSYLSNYYMTVYNIELMSKADPNEIGGGSGCWEVHKLVYVCGTGCSQSVVVVDNGGNISMEQWFVSRLVLWCLKRMIKGNFLPDNYLFPLFLNITLSLHIHFQTIPMCREWKGVRALRTKCLLSSAKELFWISTKFPRNRRWPVFCWEVCDDSVCELFVDPIAMRSCFIWLWPWDSVE